MLVDRFFQSVDAPIVIVSSLPASDQEAVAQFLLRLNTPVYLEGISGLREDPRLQRLRITYLEQIWELPVDAIFRVGGVPTARIWRDLESKQHSVNLLSYSHLKWKGVSWGRVVHGEYGDLLKMAFTYPSLWYEEPKDIRRATTALLEEFNQSEPGIIHQLSKLIPSNSFIYLGNSLPIREWDLAATDDIEHSHVYASRGVNGIDGQLSTFLGMSRTQSPNWCVLGDLTTLYDLAAPWILNQLEPREINIVVINNGGGMIFSHVIEHKSLQNRHSLDFRHFANMWNLHYCQHLDSLEPSLKPRLIELVPSQEETRAFWQNYSQLAVAKV